MMHRNIILFVCLMLWGALALFPLTAQAQDVIPAGPSLSIPETNSAIKPLAQKFYARCMSKPDATLSEQDNEEYCVCLSTQLYRPALTQAERSYLATGEGAGIEKHKLYGQIYGPCIGIPGRAATYYKCTHAHDIYKLVKTDKDADAMCRCVNKEMAPYWDEEVPAFLQLSKTYRRPFDDLLTFLMESRDFPPRYIKARSKCVSQYGRRD